MFWTYSRRHEAHAEGVGRKRRHGLRAGLSLTLLLTGLTLLAVPAAAAPSDTADVTFHRDVEPIFQRNCQSCHREGGANYGGMIAPMPLLTYEQARPWARAIARQVEARAMPPWHASKAQDGHFANERGLTDAEIDTVVQWVKAGAQRGDASDAPLRVEWADLSGWTIGEPDLVLEMPERYWVADDVEDEYRYFRMQLTKEQLPEDRWIQAFEFRPGSSAVHHIILNPIGGIAPGTDATVFREGVGQKLRAGAKLSWEVHYHKEPGSGSGVWDRSRIALKFYPKGKDVPFPLQNAEMGNYGFEIPPGASDHSVSTEFRFKRDSHILAYSPHMHLRGKAARYEAFFPNGERRTLLDVPRYDFNWQTTYRYEEPLFVPEGTRLRVTTTWDNSAENPNNPDPTKAVRYGEPTTDEMSFGYVDYIHAKAGMGSPARITRASASSGEVWRDAQLGLEYDIPPGLEEVPSDDGLVAFSNLNQVPHVDVGSETIGFVLSSDDIAQVILAELGGAEARSVEPREQWGLPGTELVVDWELDGFPLTSLVAAAMRGGDLVTVVVTELRGARVEQLRGLARRLRLTEPSGPDV